MGGHVGDRVDLAHDPLGIDEERLAPGVLGVALVLGPDHVEGLAEGAVAVGQEAVREVLLDGELLVLCGRVEGDAEDDRVGLVEFGGSITEPLSFDRSAAGAGFGVPPQHDPLAELVFQLDDVAILVGQSK